MFGYLIRRRKRLSAQHEEEEKRRIGRNGRAETSDRRKGYKE